MAVTEISLKAFRKDWRAMLEQVDAGVTVVLSCGDHRRYTIQPIEEEFTLSDYVEIERGMSEIEEGDCIRILGTSESINSLIDTL